MIILRKGEDRYKCSAYLAKKVVEILFAES